MRSIMLWIVIFLALCSFNPVLYMLVFLIVLRLMLLSTIIAAIVLPSKYHLKIAGYTVSIIDVMYETSVPVLLFIVIYTLLNGGLK